MAVLVRNDGTPISGLPEIGMMKRKSSKLDLRGSTLPPVGGEGRRLAQRGGGVGGLHKL